MQMTRYRIFYPKPLGADTFRIIETAVMMGHVWCAADSHGKKCSDKRLDALGGAMECRTNFAAINIQLRMDFTYTCKIGFPFSPQYSRNRFVFCTDSVSSADDE